MVCLGRPESENYSGVLKLLGVLLSEEMAYTEKQRILEEDFLIPMRKELESEVSSMCNLSDGVEARGIAKGIAKGVTSTTLQSIRSLMETVGWTAEQAMDALKIPKEEQEKYMKMLED